MKILEVLQKEAILENLVSMDKKGILEELVAPVAKAANVSEEVLVKVLLDRERLGSTGIGGGVGIPHGKLKNLENIVLGFGLSRRGVDFESMDGKPTHIFFLLVTPENSTGLHLKMLARISRLLKDASFKEQLISASSQEHIFTIIQEADEEF